MGLNNLSLEQFLQRRALLEQLKELIVDLGWEYDRMSSSGKESYDEICEIVGVE